MSGGVDSALSAYLLKEQGYEVEGIYLKLHDLVPNYHQNNLNKIDKITKLLDIKCHIVDISDEFEKNVYDYFIGSYIRGITPNPCVICNAKIKFGLFYDIAKSHGASKVATGHYVKKDKSNIYKAQDESKDQSYFLALINKDVIGDVIFPLQDYEKSETKRLASQLGLIEDETSYKDSQEICFVEGEYTDILQKHIDIDMDGKTYDKDKNEIGHHKGYMHYTIGKRRGFYVHGAHDPHYVVDINPADNSIVVGKKEDLEINSVKIDSLNLLDDSLKDSFECDVKLRYRSKTSRCRVEILSNNQAQIELIEPAFGVANGQIAVFYDDDRLLGGGVIISRC
jgi:tRNA-specific 2-thiouridylase